MTDADAPAWTTLDSAAFEPGVEYGEAPDWWPPGASEQLVREAADAGCPHCGALVDALDNYRDGVAPDGEHATLASFTQEVPVANE